MNTHITERQIMEPKEPWKSVRFPEPDPKRKGETDEEFLRRIYGDEYPADYPTGATVVYGLGVILLFLGAAALGLAYAIVKGYFG